MIEIKTQVMRGTEISEQGKFDQKIRDTHLNGSEAGGCIRKQWYAKHGAEAAPQEWGYARRGTHAEKYLVSSLLQANVPIRFVGDDQLSLQDAKRKISSTPDGVLDYEDEWIGIEFKSIDPRTNRSYLPKEAHVTQLQIAMAMIDEQVDRPKGIKFSRGLLVYIDASNFDDIIQFDVNADPGILDRMAKRAKKVLNTKDVAVLDREGKRNGGKECQSMCPFKAVCGVSPEDASSRKRANRGSNMDAAAIRYMEIKDQTDALKIEQDGLKEDIKNELHSRKVNKGIVGNIEVSLSMAKGRASLDKKAVKAAGIDLSPFETVGAASERLTLKRV